MLNNMTAIKKRHQGHWFDPGSLRFFNSKFPRRGVYPVPGGAFFISLNTAKVSISARDGCLTARFVGRSASAAKRTATSPPFPNFRNTRRWRTPGTPLRPFRNAYLACRRAEDAEDAAVLEGAAMKIRTFPVLYLPATRPTPEMWARYWRQRQRWWG